jgi:hypothetical protein
VGISGGYLSEIIGKRKCPKIDKQENIAKELGFKTLLDFVEFGKTVCQDDMVAAIPKTKVQPTSTQPPASSQCRGTDLQKQKRHHQIIDNFRNHNLAVEINQLLVRLEELEDDDGLKAALEWAKYRVHEAEKKRGLTKTANGTEGQ